MAESCVAVHTVHLVVRPINFGLQLGTYPVHARIHPGLRRG